MSAYYAKFMGFLGDPKKDGVPVFACDPKPVCDTVMLDFTEAANDPKFKPDPVAA